MEVVAASAAGVQGRGPWAGAGQGQVLRPPGALPTWLHLPAPGHTDRLLRHQVYSDLLQVRGYAEYYCNSTRMSSHFQLYICITWKFNLLSTLGTRPAPWLPGWPASTSPSSPASTPPPPAAQVPGSFLRGFPQSALADPGSGGGPSGSYCLSANIINL